MKASHETWTDRLSQAKLRSCENQLASEALELALRELEDCLASGLPPNESGPPSLDGAMAFIRGHKPPA